MIEKECIAIYIEATQEHIVELLKRAQSDPKPIYYRPDFVDEQLPKLLAHFKTDDISKISAKEVGAYMYPKVLEQRVPRYEEITRRIGYKMSMTDLLKVDNSDQFLNLVAKTIDKAA